MTSRPWEELVVEGARLAESRPLDRWAVGDLCLMAVPPGKTREERSANQRRLAKFAADTGLGLNVVKDCWRTSERWPAGTRIPGISQAQHSRYAARPDRVKRLLRDSTPDELPKHLREKVEKAEELLADPKVRAAIIGESRDRRRKIIEAAKAIEDEELTSAKINQRLWEQHERARLAEPEILASMDRRAISANTELHRMITKVLDLATVADHVPVQYRSRTAENLERIQSAAGRVLEKLRPATRSPQPRNMLGGDADHQSGAEHR